MDEKQELRRSRRDSVFRVATITLPGADEPLSGRVRDVSDGGARIELVEGLRPGMSIGIAIGSKPSLPATIAWVSGGKCGVVFHRDQSPTGNPRATCPDAGPTAGWVADMRDRYRRRPGD